ncbi:purine-nucleoside phosphorylase [Clostridium sp. C105KSO13]|uniref:purine-nucleoside phosphorylase n=1 Tax=Clostridium sp. C105KSO13 TaxID=1776045 RepID=UPI0007407924|nr:purine-nucleoside phosphorylase [Clostridium sp. C105KSO13]CUX42115.1 Purine nucleoside phosphorylase 1 [Clostridium sp. C105KSO13]
MSRQYAKLMKCYEYYRSVTDFKPRVGLILGSGLGNYARNMKVEHEIPYGDIPGFPVSTVEGHDGRFLLGYIGDVPAVVMKGRVHYYEGYSMEDVVLPTRLMKMMGIETLLLTNASGGINRNFQAGDFMLITDQISNFVPSPLLGENVSELGTRFPDMTHIYDEKWLELARTVAKEENIVIHEGVYLQTTGPNFESPAEIRMFGALGADAVGMSTACEAIAARHEDVRVCGISCVSNMASGIAEEELSHLDVQAVADKRGEEFERLVTRIIEQM